MEDLKCRGYAGDVPVYCAHDKIVPVVEVKPNPKNPNHHPDEQIELLAKIIKTQGWRAPVTVSTLSGLVVRGHGRLMAAKFLGLDCVPVDFQHYESNDAELADLLADNKIAELAEIDSKMLAEVFKDIDPDAIDIDITGYSEEEYNDIISALMDATAPEPGELEEDEVVEVREKAISRYGDIWLLGKHRLMCGDSTHIEDAEKLMDGAEADLLLTDPPYNVDYEGATKEHLTIQNDNMDDASFRQFLCDAFKVADACLKPGAAFYIWHADTEGYNFRGACKDIGWQVRQCLIWVKNTFVMGRQDYHWQHEPCLYGWKDGAAHQWEGDRKQATTMNFDKPMRNGEHPTMKPVALFAYQAQNNTKTGNVVLDLFGGSGTTIIACEQLNRRGYVMELDPRYVDVIVKRYIGVTGKTDVTLLRDGEEIPVEETGILN